MAKKPTGHIFSSKTRQSYKKIKTPEYFEQHILPKIMDKMDVSTLTNPEKESLKEYLKMQRKLIKITIETSDLPKSDAITDAINSGLLTRRFGNSAQQLFEHLLRQRQFFEGYKQDKQLNNPNTHPDNNYDYSYKEFMKDDDKWRLLRKLAEIDPRLNYDRAWASETLHEIERLIEQKQWSYDEIEEMMVDSFQSLVKNNQEWDKDLYGFYTDTGDFNEAQGNFGDPAYYAWEKAYRGFHGNTKAEQERFARFMKDVRNYEAMWQDPDTV